MANTAGDIYPYRNADFDERTKTGKHFIQFWSSDCEDSKSMIPLLIEIDQALGQGAEDIWIARVQSNKHTILKKRFNIYTTPVVMYIVDGNYYTYEGFWRLPDVLEYLRGGYLTDIGKEIPPPIGPMIEIIESPPPSKYELLLDWIFGQPDVALTERKGMIVLKKISLFLFVATLFLKKIKSRMKWSSFKTGTKVD
jgi:thiol-disulfide isomerase/thioredoxin